MFSDSAAGIKRCHGAVARFLAWTGLRANPAKCAFLPITTNARGNPVRDESIQLELHGDNIATLSLQDSYQYLGVGDGFDHVRHRLQLAPKLTALKLEAVALLRSELAPWQILKALKTYIYPKVEYALRHLRPLQSQLQGFDRAIVRGLRHLLRLPQSATTEIFFAPTSGGGLGLKSLVEMHHALQLGHAWQMLHSKDPAIGAIARAQVVQVVHKRFKLDVEHWRERDDELVQLFLNSELAASPHATVKRHNGDIGSLWTDVQRHLLTLGLKLERRDDDTAPGLLHLRVPHHGKWLCHKTVLRHVKLHMKIRHQSKWKDMCDQGRMVREHGGAGAKFMTTGAGLTDDEYRFAVAARTNQLDTHSALKRRRLRANATCRAAGCSRPETLAHVLNHCAPNMDAIRQRHDDALEQIAAPLKRAVEASRGVKQLRLNQTVPEFNGTALRPDIQLFDTEKRTVVIADLAITYEDQPTDSPISSSLKHSRDLKITKYQPIAAALQRAGWRVHLAGIVYGSAGAVLTSNFTAYTELLGMLKRDARRLDTNLSSHCIKASRRIWGWHCSQHRMRQREGHQAQSRRGSGGGPCCGRGSSCALARRFQAQ